jgi:gliding motility-associated-like protein/uncharacterized repeat protein (TIGR01451 family)
MKIFFTKKSLTVCQRYFGLLLFLMIFSNSFAQNICRPISQTNSKKALLLCIGMSVKDPDMAIDNDPDLTTFATLKNTLGLACSVEETFYLNQTAKKDDQIAIYFGTGSGLLNLSLLSNVSLQAKFDDAEEGDIVPLNSPLLNLSILKGDKIGVLRYTFTGDANQIKIQTGGLLSLLVNLKIYDIRLEFEKPIINGGGEQTVCFNQSTTLTATAATGTELAWYDSPTSTTVLSSTNSLTTPNLTVSKTYYVSVSRNAGCEGGERVPVIVNVLNPLTPSVATAGTKICSSSPTRETTLSVIGAVPGTTYSWYSTATGGTSIFSGAVYTPTVAAGTTSFYVEASIGSCKSEPRTKVDVVLATQPVLATILTQSVTVLSGQNATLTALTNEAGVVIDWYDVPTGGSALMSNSNSFTTPIITTTKTYYVETHNPITACVSTTRLPVTVTVQAIPLGTCLEANSQQTTRNGLCLLCGVTDEGKSVDGLNSTATNLSIPIGLINGRVQQTLQFNNAGKAGDVIEVELGIPGNLTDVGILSYISLATYNGGSYNNDRCAVNNSLLNVQLLVGGRFRVSYTAGASFDRVEIQLAGLATLLTSLDIYGASYKYKVPVVSGNSAICYGQTTLLKATSVIGDVINWYAAPNGGASLANTASYTTPNLFESTIYYIEIKRGTCVNSTRYPVPVTVNNPIIPIVDSAGTKICGGKSTTLTIASPVAGTIYKWYDLDTAGTLLFIGTAFTTPILNANKSYYVEASIGGCINSMRKKVDVIVDALPLVPNVEFSIVTIQSGQSAVLQVLNWEVGVEYDWYLASTNARKESNTPKFTTDVLTESTSYYVVARNTITGCISAKTSVDVIVNNTPITACLSTINQTNGHEGVACLGCGILNAADAIDGNNATASHLAVSVGLAAWYHQTLVFGSTGKSGDIINVELGTPSLVTIGLLSNITIATYKGGTFNNDRTALNPALLNIQLLGNNRFKVSYIPTAEFDRVEIRFGGLLNVLDKLDIYGASYSYAPLTVTGIPISMCAGNTAALSVTTAVGDEVSWFAVPTGGTALLTNSNTFTTPILYGTTVYYIEVPRAGCVNNIGQAVTINATPIPTDADITIDSIINAPCIGEGDLILSPTTTITGAQFKYYTSQLKTQEITATYTGHIGVSYSKDAITGALTINGLTFPIKYYISLVTDDGCESDIDKLKEVTVNVSATTLNVITPLIACGAVNLKNAILNFDTIENTTFTFFDNLQKTITAEAAANITTGGIYFIQAQSNAAGSCPSVKKQVDVIINPLPTLSVDPSQVWKIGDDVTLIATHNGTIKWYDPKGVPLLGNTTGNMNTAGFFTYTAVATLGTCTTTKTVTITVIDPDSCPLLRERVYANSESSGFIVTGSVSDRTNAIDKNPQTFSTITTGLGILGIGTAWQHLQWDTPILKGTPVTIKLGSDVSAVSVASGISVIATKRNGSGYDDIGVLQSVSGSLLNLLSGINIYEFTFVPTDALGPQDYDGIRIVSGSLLSVVQHTNVYEAYHYYKETPPVVSPVVCTPGDILDVFSGATDLGIGALTATVGVSDPWKIADNDVSTYATMFSALGVLAASDLTAEFKTPTMVDDKLRIVISKPGTPLGVNLLTGFSVQCFLGATPVGDEIESTSALLSLELLAGDSMAMVMIAQQTEPYDRVRIRLGGVANVLDLLRVHSVDRLANTKVMGADFNNKITVCPASDVTLEVSPEVCYNYNWYDSAVGGNKVATGPTFTIPSALAAGVHKFYVQPVRFDCEALSRGEVTIEVKATAAATSIADVTINGDTDASICSESGDVTLNANLSDAPVLTNPKFHWYRFDGTTSQLITGQTTSQLVLTGLTPGTYTYYLGVSSVEYCETASADRKLVTFTILPYSDLNDITIKNAKICQGTKAILTPSSTLVNPVFYWYFDSNKTQPIIHQSTIGGVTFTISTTGVLTVIGLTNAISPVTYYVAVASDNTCQNKNGKLKAVTVIVIDPPSPTTDNISQPFCKVSNPTFASIQVSPAIVVWYSASTDGTAFALTDPLISGVYYAASIDVATGCESSGRLEVTITVTDLAKPTTNNPIQDFCQSDNPTFTSIQTDQPNVVWYATETSGTALSGSTPLTAGIYYTASKDVTTGCESSTRLKVIVTFSGNDQAIISGGAAQSCVFDTVTYTTNPGMKNYVWTVSNGNITSGGLATNNFVTITWSAIGSGSVNVSYMDNCGVGHNSNFILDVKTCSDITISKTVDNPTPSIDDNVTFTITVNNIGKGYFKNIVVSENIPSGYLFVNATASVGTYNNISGNWDIPLLDANKTATLMVTVKVLSKGNYLNTASITISNPEDLDDNNNNSESSVTPLCLIVYNEFSPNNDGNNDLFRIDCIENYPNNKFEVYNRYGALVYSKNNYTNDWDGKVNVSGAINKDDKLPAGTYYYTLNVGSDSIVKTGWLSIIR